MELSQRLKLAIAEYKNGNVEAFTPLYEESSKYIYACVYKVLRGNDNAADITADVMQDTYIEISRSIGLLENEERFLSWAGTIAGRKALAYIKKNERMTLLNEEDDSFDNLSDSDNIIPEEIMQSKEKQRLLREIIDTELTEMQKLCIVAYYYNELKQSEIAKELGIPENTVKTNLSRAKARIKEGVLTLEEKKGTRLYNIAPFMLLLLSDEMQAAPAGVLEGRILSAVNAAVSSMNLTGQPASQSAPTGQPNPAAGASKGIFAKIAGMSTVSKVVAVVLTVCIVGRVAVAVYVAGQQKKAEEAAVQEQIIEQQMQAEATEVETETETETETELVHGVTAKDVVASPSEHMDFYPEDAEIDTTTLWFALADIDGDGSNEVFLTDQYLVGEETPKRIVNILTEKNGVASDYDGFHLYDNQADFTLYDTGILKTYLWDGWGYTVFWDLNTGDSWNGAKYKPVEGSLDLPADERETHAEIADEDGNIYGGEEGDALYEYLCRGNEIPLVWYEATSENIDSMLSNLSVEE